MPENKKETPIIVDGEELELEPMQGAEIDGIGEELEFIEDAPQQEKETDWEEVGSFVGSSVTEPLKSVASVAVPPVANILSPIAALDPIGSGAVKAGIGSLQRGEGIGEAGSAVIEQSRHGYETGEYLPTTPTGAQIAQTEIERAGVHPAFAEDISHIPGLMIDVATDPLFMLPSKLTIGTFKLVGEAVGGLQKASTKLTAHAAKQFTRGKQINVSMERMLDSTQKLKAWELAHPDLGVFGKSYLDTARKETGLARDLIRAESVKPVPIENVIVDGSGEALDNLSKEIAGEAQRVLKSDRGKTKSLINKVHEEIFPGYSSDATAIAEKTATILKRKIVEMENRISFYNKKIREIAVPGADPNIANKAVAKYEKKIERAKESIEFSEHMIDMNWNNVLASKIKYRHDEKELANIMADFDVFPMMERADEYRTQYEKFSAAFRDNIKELNLMTSSSDPARRVQIHREIFNNKLGKEAYEELSEELIKEGLEKTTKYKEYMDSIKPSAIPAEPKDVTLDVVDDFIASIDRLHYTPKGNTRSIIPRLEGIQKRARGNLKELLRQSGPLGKRMAEARDRQGALEYANVTRSGLGEITAKGLMVTGLTGSAVESSAYTAGLAVAGLAMTPWTWFKVCGAIKLPTDATKAIVSAAVTGRLNPMAYAHKYVFSKYPNASEKLARAVIIASGKPVGKQVLTDEELSNLDKDYEFGDQAIMEELEQIQSNSGMSSVEKAKQMDSIVRNGYVVRDPQPEKYNEDPKRPKREMNLKSFSELF